MALDISWEDQLDDLWVLCTCIGRYDCVSLRGTFGFCLRYSVSLLRHRSSTFLQNTVLTSVIFLAFLRSSILLIHSPSVISTIPRFSLFAPRAHVSHYHIRYGVPAHMDLECKYSRTRAHMRHNSKDSCESHLHTVATPPHPTACPCILPKAQDPCVTIRCGAARAAARQSISRRSYHLRS